jgi:hypothetical protein
MAELATRTIFVCVGVVDDAVFYKAKALLEAMALASLASGQGELSIKVQAMLEPEFDLHLMGEVKRLRGAAFQHTASPFITMVGPNRLSTPIYRLFISKYYDIQLSHRTVIAF